MEFEINYLVILACGVLSMVVGFVWYGPLFGKQWMHLIGVDPNDQAAKAQMQKGMWSTMAVQMATTLFLVWVLYIYLVAAAEDMSMMSNALWIWAGFVVPTLASTVLWTNESTKDKWTRFLIQAGYNLVMFAAFAYIIMTWG
jgi:hypothetical protein